MNEVREVEFLLQSALLIQYIMDFVQIDNYQDKFAFMLLERIEHLEKLVTGLECELCELKKSTKKHTPDPDSHLEIFGYTTSFLYFKFPIKYYFVTPESHKQLISDALKILVKCFPSKAISVDVFLYTTYYMQFNVSFDSPVFISDALPILHKELRVLADKPISNDFTAPDIVLTRYLCTIQKDGHYSIVLTNYMYDIGN